MLLPSMVIYPPVTAADDVPVADLDWATGLIRVFFPLEDFRRIINKGAASLDDDERYALEALTHEATHLLQLSLTGFAYDFSRRLLQVVLKAAGKYRTLEEILAARGEYSSAIEELFRSLNRMGPHGLTPRTIIESAAFLAQKASHYEPLGPATYEEMLANEVAHSEYRLAYDIAAEYLGALALDHLPHVANLALATREPEVVFIPLLEEFRDKGSRLDIEHNHRLGLALLNARFGAILLGSAMDQLASGRDHPILSYIVAGYNDLANQGRLAPITLNARGRAYDSFTASLLAYPMFFPPSNATGRIAPIWLPAQWKSNSGDSLLQKPDVLRWLFAASQLLQQDLEPVEPAPLRPPTRSSATSQLNMPTAARAWEFSRDNRTRETSDHFAGLLRKISEDGRMARTLRGTVAITFPDAEFGESRSPLLDEGVQWFLRRLFTDTPHLLYFLSDAAEASALLEFVAAFFPSQLMPQRDGGVSVAMTAEVMQGFAVMLHRAASFAVELGQPPQIVLAHLSRFPKEVREAFSQALSE